MFAQNHFVMSEVSPQRITELIYIVVGFSRKLVFAGSAGFVSKLAHLMKTVALNKNAGKFAARVAKYGAVGFVGINFDFINAHVVSSFQTRFFAAAAKRSNR
jgi:hypothetical protein